MSSKIFKKILGILGYKLLEKNYIKNTRLVSKGSTLNLSNILEKLFYKKLINSAIQIGANDGNQFDNLSLFIKKYNTKTILVEPIKEHFEELKKNYYSYKNVIFENLAISENEEVKYLYSVKQKYQNSYGAHAKAIGSFDIKHLIKHGIKKNHIEKISTKTISLNELINKHDFSNFDLLFIDAEGYDGEIVINFLENKLKCKIIIFEYIHIDNETLKKLINLLIHYEYKFFSVNENLVCLKENISLEI
tara:strand:- start:75 stop:818 length:744 start_codon:yes stop_codon:yes gene_type:complete